MMMKLPDRKWHPGLWVFGITFLIYTLLFSRRVLLDITAQMQTLVKVCSGDVNLPPTALFYVLSWITALGRCDFRSFMGAAVVVLSALAFLKWHLTRQMLAKWAGKNPSDAGLSWLALALGFVCSLPTTDWFRLGYYMAGQPSPNYWMNGTILASWPFALVLFAQSYEQLERPRPSWWRWQMLWLWLLVVSKPSYIFVFALVYPVFFLKKHGWRHPALRWHLLPLVVGALAVLIEYWLIFLQPDSVYVRDFNGGRPSGVVLKWAFVWSLWSTNIPVSIVAAMAFPLAAAITYWKEFRQNLLFQYAWAGFGVALLISLSFMQQGDEYYAWNFRYQHYIAAYLLYAVSACLLWQKMPLGEAFQGQWHVKKNAWLWSLFGLHLLSGVVYLIKFWITKEHY